MRWALLALALLAAGCMHTLRPAVDMDPDAFPVLPPSVWGCGFDAEQSILARHGDQSWGALALIRARPEALRMAALSPAGVTLYVLLQRADGTVTVEQRLPMPEGFDPRRVLRDFQLAAAPLDALCRALRPPWRLQSTPQGLRLLHRGEPVLELTLPAGRGPDRPARLSDRRLGYTLAVDPLQYRPLATAGGACQSDP